MAKKKKQTIGTINTVDLIINGADKMNRSMGIVKTGCGAHKSKKDYNRQDFKRVSNW